MTNYYRQIVMARGDVISEVFNSEGQRTGTVVYNERQGTVRDIRRTGKTVQSRLQMAPANANNPNVNPQVRVRRAVTGRR